MNFNFLVGTKTICPPKKKNKKFKFENGERRENKGLEKGFLGFKP